MNGGGQPSTAIRAFLAFEIPLAIKERLERDMAALHRQLPPARWVRPGGLHLTIKFLGESRRGRLDDLSLALGRSLAALPPVTVTLGGSGFFPTASRARVAWIGGTVSGVEPVVDAVERMAVHAGWPPERRGWSLHLTLARLKTPWPRAAASRFLEWGGHLDFEPFRCSELVLFSSQLRPSGAVYTRLAGIPLEGTEARGERKENVSQPRS
ncbi:MAG: RNA 2',3'-cyclic phosphodiesterase [Acidobacteria bacterium]|nr:RNA 2',3'-cyclic phosphodiesterase [Acidobacteriota bacterium]